MLETDNNIYDPLHTMLALNTAIVSIHRVINTKDRIILENYPTYQQTQENTCGPAVGLTVLYYYGNKKLQISELLRYARNNVYTYK